MHSMRSLSIHIVQCLLTEAGVVDLPDIHHLLASCLCNHLRDALLHQSLHGGLNHVHRIAAAERPSRDVGDTGTSADLEDLLLATGAKA